ncbi:uncharacterized protein EHS24_003294 [Apiotrichum porosum]|uniref:Sugar phosphate phosphatase n=1 Tax=Apiotrichum porosum TaxID=105984 RepID=A0A427XEQ0_9TREE|nr:uncharacterized protein EHS24_003294 [Apiotrichum porosum]RSH77335.1 hypothetical protein EHS24_003294 [Apiotrichum porosum]
MASKAHPSAKAPSKTMLNLGNLPPRQKQAENKPAAYLVRPLVSTLPPWPAYRGYHEYSFAHVSHDGRAPANYFGQAINDVYQTLNQEYDEGRVLDLLDCVERMQQLMDDLHGNAKLRPIVDDGAGDVALWNKEIAKFFRGKDFMNAPWLFAEAYKYRRSATDPSSTEKNKLIFLELTQIDGGEHLAATEKNILGNDLHKLADYVLTLKGGRVDFVLDNAGFELYCDLVYADWLIQAGICSQIVFHGKRIPWFVSDVTRKDWDWILNTACLHGHLFEDAPEEDMHQLRAMGRRWKQYEKEGKWKYEQHPFWCTGFSFWDLNNEAPTCSSTSPSRTSSSSRATSTTASSLMTATSHPVDVPQRYWTHGLGPRCAARVLAAHHQVGRGRRHPEEVGARLDEEEPDGRFRASTPSSCSRPATRARTAPSPHRFRVRGGGEDRVPQRPHECAVS